MLLTEKTPKSVLCAPVSLTDASDSAYEVVWFEAGDGRPLNFHRYPPAEASTNRGPVLLVAGTSVRANIFSPPQSPTLPQVLCAAGYDVWILNWRGSIDLPPVEFTLDEPAIFDCPAAVRAILEFTGEDTLKAVVHCQGSTSFMMSLVSGLLPQVSMVVSNAVSLHPVMPRLARLKLAPAMKLFRPFIDEVTPQWALHAPGFWPKALTLGMRALHHECDNPVCKMSSFIYGAGHPTLWRHENLSSETHEWLGGELAQVPLSFLSHMQSCLKAGHIVSTGKYRDLLPDDFVAQAPRTDARVVFMTGDLNATFLPVSQEKTYDFFERFARGRHVLQKIHGYGHLDVFIGKHSASEVFPLIVDELNRPI
jgi:hypothetical protein